MMTFKESLVLAAAVAIVLAAVSINSPAKSVAQRVDNSASLCKIDETDGYLVRQPDGTLKAFVLIGEEIWGQDTFVPCKYLKRNRHA